MSLINKTYESVCHDTTHYIHARLHSITQSLSIISLVAQSLSSAYLRDDEEGDRLATCIVELSHRALAEMRVHQSTNTGEADWQAGPALARPCPQKPFHLLTPRERDVFRLLAKGLSNKAIAHDLHLTVGTVKGYINHIFSKLGVVDRTQAALLAAQHGLAEPCSDF